MARVAVIGGAGYVGLTLCAELRVRGHDVTAVTRPNGRFLLERLGVRVESPDDLQRVGPIEAVVNLAYPNRGSIYEYPQRNRELLAIVRRLAAGGARVVHTSTQAVFGFAMEYPIVVGPVRDRRDYLYIESKIELENLLARACSDGELHIVRLGNVWGPASPTWTAALADKLLFGDPVGVAGEDGFCNATDVANVAAYLAFLIEAPTHPGAKYHHLAELGETRWSWWIDRLASMLKVAPVFAEKRRPYPRSLTQELRATWVAHSPLTVAGEWIYGRFTGSLLRSAVRTIPTGVFAFLKRHRRRNGGEGRRSPLAGGDPVFLTVMGAERRFETRVDAAWSPPVDREGSWRGIAEWMREAGY
jgi:nucleoside-diphosphate-sugar epimerase